MKISCVYAITNTVSGRRYIGSSANWRARRNQHLRGLRLNRHPSPALQNAWNKYGWRAFVFSPLLICAPKDLLFYEKLAIESFDAVKSGYNIRREPSSNLGVKMSEETRLRQSAAQKRRWAAAPAEAREAVGKRSAGRVWSEESRAKVGAAHRGRKHSPAVVARMVAAHKYGPLSSDVKAKISASNKGRVFSEAHRANLSKALKGRTFSDEARAKMSIAARNRQAPIAPSTAQLDRLVAGLMARHGVAG